MRLIDRAGLKYVVAACLVAIAGGCGSSSSDDTEGNLDASSLDGASSVPEGGPDADYAPLEDATPLDAAPADAGAAPVDATVDAAPPGVPEASLVDQTVSDSASQDTGAGDVAPIPPDVSFVAETGAPDADAAAPTSWLVQAGSTLNIQGLTNDGQLAYFDTNSQGYYAVPVAGGTPTLIYAVPPSSYYTYTREVGNSVFVFDVGSNYVSLVTLWSAGFAQPVTLTTAGLATYYSSVWASDDGQHIAYLQVGGDGTVGGIYGANADGSNPTLLVGDIMTPSGGAPGRCFPLVTLTNRYAVASFCTAADAGSTPIVEAFDVANGWAPGAEVQNAIFTRSTFSTPTNPFFFPYAFDPDGGSLIAATSMSASGALQSFLIDGGEATVLDPAVPMASPLELAGGVAGPGYAVYTTDAGALKQAYATNPTPQTLVSSGVTLMDGLSPDGNWMLVSSGSNTRGLLDISAVSTTNPGSPLVVATMAEYGNLGLTVNTFPGGGFTGDSKYAVVLTNLTEDSVGGTVFLARSLGLTAPYAGRLLSNGFAVLARPLTGSKVLMADNFQDVDGGANSVPLVDFELVDTSNDAPGQPLVTGINADGNYALSADNTLLVYDVYSGAAPGLYAITLR
jgi:hypothetical protein